MSHAELKKRAHRLGWALAILASYLCVYAAEAVADRGAYRITRFHTDLWIRENSDLLVHEQLTVDFSRPRHGIYRTIPIRYTDPTGYQYSFGFDLLDVTDENGQSHPARVERRGRDVRIRIGDADRTVRGRVVYKIRYRVRDALRHFPDHDELYWNATGNDWKAPVDRASATVYLPAPLPMDSLEVTAFAGRYRGREQDVHIEQSAPNEIAYVYNESLAPLEGLTIAVAWPHGYVRFPGRLTRLARFCLDNLVLLVPLLALGFLWNKYWSSGRDPMPSRSVFTRYEPPEGISPGGIGTLVDERVDMGDITASIVDLAVRGYLVIRTEKKDLLWGLTSKQETIFERQEKPEDELLPHEKELLLGLFLSGDVVSTDDLKEKFYKRIPDIKAALYDRLVEKRLFAGNPDSVRKRWAGAGVGVGVLVVALGALWAHARGGVMPNMLIVPIVAGVATMVLFLAFAPAMPRRTGAGVRMRNWALGFQEFADRVERDRFEADAARNVFERLLPYAMALGVAAKWSRRFEGIYADATPHWYVGPHLHSGAMFSTSALEQSLSSTMSSAGQTMTSSPRSSGSSGFGGGGFSGGGGGGGGGGSW